MDTVVSEPEIHLAAKNGIHRNQSQNHVLDGPIKYDMYRQRTSYITSPNNQNLLWHYTFGVTPGNIQKAAQAFQQ